MNHGSTAAPGSLRFKRVGPSYLLPCDDCRTLNRAPTSLTCPGAAIACTAHALVEKRDRCLALGMQEHLTKPIEPARLYAALVHWGQRTVEAADNPPAGARPDTGTGTTPPPSGLDLDGGLRRTAGNVGLYHRLLSSLANTQANAASRLENTLQAGQPSDDDLDLFRRTLAETVALIRGLPTTGRPLAEGPGESNAKTGTAASLEAAIPSSAELVERLRALLQAGDEKRTGAFCL